MNNNYQKSLLIPMRLSVLTIFLSMFLLSCASNPGIRQTIMRNQATSLDALLPNDQLTLDKNWKIAEELADQDRMAWIGTDSILPVINENEKAMIKGYIVIGNPFRGEVYFYTFNYDSIFKAVAVASFSGGEFNSIAKNISISDSNIIKSALCIQKAKEMNANYINQQRTNYNSYSFFSDTGFTVYLAPGSIDNYLILCGGIKTVFDKDLKVISNTELHKSIVVFKSNQKGDVMARSSSVTDVINEIDILQYLILKNVVYNQMITTKKYAFFLYNIPDEHRIVRQVLVR